MFNVVVFFLCVCVLTCFQPFATPGFVNEIVAITKNKY